MGATNIPWTDNSWPVVQGCDYESPGCAHCYAVPLLWRLAHNPLAKVSAPLQGLVDKAPNGKLHFTGRVELRHDRLADPLRWKKPRRIFVPSHGDLFHPNVPFDFIDQIVAMMALASRHTFQILTKRPARMMEYFMDFTQARSDGRGNALVKLAREHRLGINALIMEQYHFPLPNVWLGTSTEDQQRFNERWPHLRDTPAAVRFISYEPALGPLDLTAPMLGPMGRTRPLMPIVERDGQGPHHGPHLDWVIVGGESGPSARSFDLEWARQIVRQCQASGTKVFVKQMGRNAVDSMHMHAEAAGGPVCMRFEDRKGEDMQEWPDDLQVREFPG